MASAGDLVFPSPLLLFQDNHVPQSYGLSHTSSTAPESLLTAVDRRIRVHDSKELPFRNILLLQARFPPIGNNNFCQWGTGFVTDEEVLYGGEPFAVVLTAAHVLCPDASSVRAGAETARTLCNRRPDSLATSVVVRIAPNGPEDTCVAAERPCAEFEVYRRKNLTTATSDYGWYEVSPNWYSPESYEVPNWLEDYGALFLKKSILPVECTGFSIADHPDLFRLACLSDADVVCAGYPLDKLRDTMWMAHGRLCCPQSDVRLLSVSSTSSQVEHNADTEGGQSGSPLYIVTADSRYFVVAMHHKGPPRPTSPGEVIMACNEALLVNRALMDKVTMFQPPPEWVARFGSHTLAEAAPVQPTDSDRAAATADGDDEDGQPFHPPCDEDMELYAGAPTACLQDSNISAHDPVVAGTFQHFKTVLLPSDVSDLSHANDQPRQAGFSKADLTAAQLQGAGADITDRLGQPAALIVTKQISPQVVAPRGETVTLCFEVSSALNSDLYYNWYQQDSAQTKLEAADANARPIDTGQVLRLTSLDRAQSVYCVASDENGYRIASNVCNISIGPVAWTAPIAGLPGGPLTTAAMRVAQNANQTDGVEANNAADIDATCSATPENPWSCSALSGTIEMLKAEMDATPACNRLLRQNFLSGADFGEISQCPTAREKNSLLIQKLNHREWKSMEALYQALVRSTQGSVAKKLLDAAKNVPGYPTFKAVIAPSPPCAHEKKLTEENVDSCKDVLSTLQIEAVASRLCDPNRLLRYALAAKLSMYDMEQHCARDNLSSLGHAMKVVSYLATERRLTVKKALAVGKKIGCHMGIREALLHITDPMADSDEGM